MRLLVVDASAAMAWLVRSQAGPRSEAFLPRLRSYRLIAPEVFAWETANQLRRFAMAGAFDLAAGIEALDALDILHFRPRSARSVFELAPIALDLGLSLYDAAYLSLAAETGAELVSRDSSLLTAARAHAIPCHDLIDRDTP